MMHRVREALTNWMSPRIEWAACAPGLCAWLCAVWAWLWARRCPQKWCRLLVNTQHKGAACPPQLFKGFGGAMDAILKPRMEGYGLLILMDPN